MAVHRLQFDEFDEIDYELIAIHTSLEDYRLAYFINQKLPILLSKKNTNITLNSKSGETHFSRFSFDDFEKENYWNLIQNKNEISIKNSTDSQNLFSQASVEMTTKVYLIPELKKVDFFLKIENSTIPTNEITSKINKIKSISAVYSVDSLLMKSKNNLIL